MLLRFITQHLVYNAGEVAHFLEDEGRALIAKGVAVLHEVEQAVEAAVETVEEALGLAGEPAAPTTAGTAPATDSAPAGEPSAPPTQGEASQPAFSPETTS